MNKLTENEIQKRREMIKKNFNMTGAGFKDGIDKEVQSLPCFKEYAEGNITFKELKKYINNYVKNL